jgi:hypothetical protein
LFQGNLQPLTPPQPFNTLVIHMPSGISQQGGNPAITVSAILAGQFDHIRNQPIFICPASWHVALC